MKKTLLLLYIIISCVIPYFLYSQIAYSDELDDINTKINELQSALDSSKKATVPLENQLNNLKSQLTNIEVRVAAITLDIAKKKKSITKSYEELAVEQELFEQTVRKHYIKNYHNNPLTVFLSGKDAAQITRILAYQKKDADQDKAMITNLALKITDLETRKKKLEGEEKKLAAVTIRLADEKKEVEKVVLGAKEYQKKLSSEIATLSVKQQQLIAAKLGSLNLPTSLGAGPLFCTDDRKLDPGFSPAFAFYTFGIPHRVGMNQYGAYGRAKAGQGYQDILRSYFDGISFEKKDSGTQIKVQGYGQMGLDDYMLGIYEMPGSWPLEALKAQVIAARSYALSYTNNGEKEICTTQSCQVYKGGNKGGDWERAVRDTSGEVMTRDGQAISAWYASTAGGYVFRSEDVGWSPKAYTKRMRDTTGDVNSFQDLFDRAYDKDSPCFYAAQGARAEYNKSAWLKSDEVADIVNVILLARRDSSTQNHLSQVDKPNPDGTDTWDKDRVKQELRSRGETPLNSINDFSIDWDKAVGRTTSITLSGDGGSRSFDATEFRNFFNLRAPSNIQIVGPLFNIERK